MSRSGPQPRRSRPAVKIWEAMAPKQRCGAQPRLGGVARWRRDVAQGQSRGPTWRHTRHAAAQAAVLSRARAAHRLGAEPLRSHPPGRRIPRQRGRTQREAPARVRPSIRPLLMQGRPARRDWPARNAGGGRRVRDAIVHRHSSPQLRISLLRDGISPQIQVSPAPPAHPQEGVGLGRSVRHWGTHRRHAGSAAAARSVRGCCPAPPHYSY
jgi:hypothetical protein